MATNIEDVLQISIVLLGVNLLKTSENVAEFLDQIGTEIVTTDVGLGSGTVNRTVAVGRDRIAINSLPDRAVISREYPKRDDIERLAQVAHSAIKLSHLEDTNLKAFGYNIELVYEPTTSEPAILHLSRRLFRENLLRDIGAQLLGGSARLHFEKGGQRWTASFEPRLQDLTAAKVFSSFNVHHENPDGQPTENDIRSSMERLWDEANEIVDLVDGTIA